MKHISQVIEKIIKRLNIALSGDEKEKLAIFPEKVLYKAMDKYCQTEAKKSAVTDPFGKYYLLCLQQNEKLNNEKPPESPKQNKIPKKGVRRDMFLTGKGKVSFTHGKQYYKHGKWYPYPDQAFDPDYRPSMPYDADCNENCGACNADKRIDRSEIIPHEELKKAIASGKMNMKGLSFLRDSLSLKPELLKLIDEALAAHKITPKVAKEDSISNGDERKVSDSLETIKNRQASIVGQMRSIGNVMRNA